MQMRRYCTLALLLTASLATAQNYLIRPGTLYQSFDDTAAWHTPDGSIVADTAHVQQGASSLMLTCTPGYSAHTYKSISTSFANVSTISFWVYAQYPVNDDGWHACSLYLTADGFANTFVATSQKIRPGWSKIVFSKSDFSSRGAPSWNSTMTAMQIAIFGDTQSGMSASFDDMDLNEYSKPKVIFAFDDNFESSYSIGFEYLKNYGFRGTEFVISSMVDQPGRATTAQLNEMYNYGWDMCNHTTTHPDLRTLTQGQAQTEIQNCTNFLVSHGWTRNRDYLHLAYPQGHFNSTVLAADAASGLLTARTTMKTLQADVIDSKYLLYSEVPDSTTQSRADIIARVNQAVVDGGTLQIAFHNLTPTPAKATDWNDSDFRAIVDYVAGLKAQGKVDVVTLTQWYNGLLPTGASLARIKANAPQVAAGISNTGIVYLNNAVTNAVTISVSANSNFVSMPSTVTIPGGTVSNSFPIATGNVASQTVVTLSATLNGGTVSGSFLIVPKAADHITFDANPVKGGTSTWGHAYLNAPAPDGGCYVALSSNNAAASVPSSVFIPAGAFHGDFYITTKPVTITTYPTISESYGGVAKTATLAVTP